MKNIGEKIHVSGKLEAKTKGTRRKMTMKLHEDKYILGYKVFKYMLGFKGFKVESTDVERTIYDLVKDLSKEEWDWIEMDPKVVENFRFVTPEEWDPPKDPRPDWIIKETQIQNKKEDA